MSERKAINKYYPPDWDPSQVPKKKKSSNPNVDKVRLMVPFSMKCLQCTEYIASRRKFNARKETTSEKYMGIKIIRFHIKCPRCNHNLVFQTDPKTAGFAPVSGIQRNYESLATQNAIKPQETEEEMLQRLEKQEKEDQDFKDQQHHRKRNPLWQAKDTSKTTMASLEEKILEQQKVQETHDHLKFLEAKARKINEFGEDLAVDQARDSIRHSIKRQYNSQEDEESLKRMKNQVSEGLGPELKTHPPAAMTVSGVIKVNANNVKRMQAKLAEARAESGSTDANPQPSQSSPKSIAKPSPNVEVNNGVQTAPTTTAFDGYNSSSDDTD